MAFPIFYYGTHARYLNPVHKSQCIIITIQCVHGTFPRSYEMKNTVCKKMVGYFNLILNSQASLMCMLGPFF